jgi:sugar phosphate isomerase/epimerase
VLENGFKGLGVAPGPRATQWAALKPVLGRLPASIAAVRASGILEVAGPTVGSLSSSQAGERTLARDRVREAVSLARTLGCRYVVLDPGPAHVPGATGTEDIGDPAARTAEAANIQLQRRDAVLERALDAACRSLYAICRESPEIHFCLTASRHIRGLGELNALTHIFEDLRALRLGYWHDAVLAARRSELLGQPQGAWLESFYNFMVGITLGDSADGGLYLPPGAGGVDYPLLASYTRRSGRPIPTVLELDPSVDPGELPGTHAFLTKYGL